MVEEAVTNLVQVFGTTGPFIVRASSSYTFGVTVVNTVMGPVEIETVLGGRKCFEIREK